MTKVELWGRRTIDGEPRPVEKLSVEYEYAIDGSRYSGTQAAFYTLVYPETVSFAEAHPERSEVPVYYNPDDPAESVLVTGSEGDNKRYSEVILASVGLIVSVAIATFGMLGILG